LAQLDYEEIIVTQGIKVPFVAEIITPKIEKAMRNNRYESEESQMLLSLLQSGDRVLELGGGVGLCSAIASSVEGVELVVTVEANPILIPMILETHRLNDITGVEVKNTVVSIGAKGPSDFYIRRDFWASSMEPESRTYEEIKQIPSADFNLLMTEVKPTVLLCDIEGGELDIFTNPALDLTGLRLLILEFHGKVYGEEGMARLTGTLAAHGMRPIGENKPGSSVQIFAPVVAASSVSSPSKKCQTWPITDPRVLIVTCMKDEGPFILEWLAWHRSIGVTDFVIFTNHCSDGTAELLDRLEDMGEIIHLPNPALATDAVNFQPLALHWARYLRVFRESDFIISMDVDEFINIKQGDGHLSDLFAIVGPFDALSICEINHGANGRIEFEPGWIKDQFPLHDSPSPGRKRARRGVKTITRLSDRVKAVRNHRPDFKDESAPVLWLDGSGKYLAELQADSTENGIDSRGTYHLVSLEHYALRSLNSFFMKMVRGDVVVADKPVSQRYWRERNRNSHISSAYNPAADRAARALHATRYENDAVLMRLHQATCEFHQKKISEIIKFPKIIERHEWIMAEAWKDIPDNPG
jgi:hypothetical protein